jgi:acetyl esterase/lipase
MPAIARRTLGPAAAAALLFLLLVSASSPRASRADEPPVEWKPDVTFCSPEGRDVCMNVALPRGLDRPAPALVVIHGGAWSAGSRRMHDRLVRTLAERGFVAASVDYRLAPRSPWPAQLEDVRAAVRWLRAHAEEWQLDPARIGAVGFSAGGHLALLLGAMDAPEEERSSRVQAVVSFFAPTDFSQDYDEQGIRLLDRLLGPEFARNRRAASPVAHVDAGDPPMLLFQGTQDRLVPYTQAVHMADALTRAGVQGHVTLLLGEGHGWGEPSLSDTQEDAVRFLKRALAAPPR